MILCLGTTPAVQRVLVLRQVTPNAVNRAVRALDGPAGKSVNVAKVLKVLGEHPVASGFLGGERGRCLRALLEAKGIELDFVDVAVQTRECATVIDQSANTQTELVQEGEPVAPADYERLRTVVRRRLKTCTAVVMSGSLTPGGPADFYARVTRLAREAGALSVVDARGAALSKALEAGPGLVKPNRLELAGTVARDLQDEAGVAAAMRELCRRGAQRVVVTAGKDPALAFDGKDFWRVFPPAIEVVNPIGCGDAFTAGLVWRLARGEDLAGACRWACAAGAANALTLMPGEVDPDEVQRLAKAVRVVKG